MFDPVDFVTLSREKARRMRFCRHSGYLPIGRYGCTEKVSHPGVLSMPLIPHVGFKLFDDGLFPRYFQVLVMPLAAKARPYWTLHA